MTQRSLNFDREGARAAMKSNHRNLILALGCMGMLACGLLALRPTVSFFSAPPVASAPTSPIHTVIPATTHASARTIDALKNYYRREQIKAELAIEQQRYGVNYWDPELGAKQLHDLHATRVLRIAELNAEMSSVLRELNVIPADAVFELTPIFSPEATGPNVTFLSSDSREKVEALIADAALHGPIDPAKFIEQLRPALSASEFAEYLKWNAPASALLRRQLVGFHASEAEFNAIAQWPGLVNPDSASDTHELETRLGAPRLAELQTLRRPERQTAIHDLHRLGLPLDYAEWLQEFRAQAVKTFQSVWQDPHAPDAEKSARVDQLQHAYRTSLLATLSPDGATFDETELLP